MIRVVKQLAGLFVLCALLPAQAVFAQAGAGQGLVRRLMDASGVSAQLRAAAKSVADEIGQARESVPDNLRVALSEAAQEGFGAEAMLADVERELPRALSADEMQAAIAWLETEAGRRVTRAEEAASQTMDSPQFQEYQRSLKDKPLPAARAQLLGELIESSDAVDFSVKVAQATAFGVAIGMNSARPRENRMSAELLRQRIEVAMAREDLAGEMAQALPRLYAFTYRDTSDADLGAYAAFLKTPAGSRYVKAFNEVMLKTIAAASYRTGSLIDERASRVRA